MEENDGLVDMAKAKKQVKAKTKKISVPKKKPAKAKPVMKKKMVAKKAKPMAKKLMKSKIPAKKKLVKVKAMPKVAAKKIKSAPAKSKPVKTSPKIVSKKIKAAPAKKPTVPAKIVAQKKISAPKVEPFKAKPKCLVLAGFGLNSEVELAYAFTLAGADAEIVHFSDISAGKKKLNNYQIFAVPGGWSFGDDIASGKVLANKLKSTFKAQIEEFVSSGKPVLGICNGFQMLVKLGALPNLSLTYAQEGTLVHNDSGKFEDRWVYLKPQKSVCKFFDGVEFIYCPVRHGEGKFLPKDEATLSLLEKKGLIVIKYVDADLKEANGYPVNPNGAVKNIAGICNTEGNVFALMPHPECSVKKVTFPRWTEDISFEKNSLRFFENIVKEAKKFV